VPFSAAFSLRGTYQVEAWTLLLKPSMPSGVRVIRTRVFPVFGLTAKLAVLLSHQQDANNQYESLDAINFSLSDIAIPKLIGHQVQSAMNNRRNDKRRRL
jgi:hypothetical protein